MATRTIRAQEVITREDVVVTGAVTPGALQDPNAAIGLEAQVALYAGRPIRPGDLLPPAVINRNDQVILIFKRGGLSIATEGRALGRARVGDRVRVMNLGSRSTVEGSVLASGHVVVGPRQDLLRALE